MGSWRRLLHCRSRMVHLGEFEQLVLLALLHFSRGGYGMQVRETIDARTGRETSIGAGYATLDRLEAKGLVASKQVEEASGRPRRIFKATAEGKKALSGALDAIDRMRAGLAPLKGES